VTVTANTGSGTTAPTLTARGRKVKGLQKVDLSWNGLSGSAIDVYRNSARVMGTPNDGAETDTINKKGGGSYTYRVCAAGTTTCSNNASVSF
jgi:thermitase